MENLIDQIKFNERGLVPVVTQDCRTDEVLMLAYMNQESFLKSIETGMMHYFSRSRNCLWFKGETSGHFQHIRSVSIDCDGDTLLFKVEQKGAACHTGHHSCFYRKMDGEFLGKAQNEENMATLEPIPEILDAQVKDASQDDLSLVLKEVFNTVADRKQNPKEGSYTNYLFEKGLDKILKKVGEEASEVIIASKNQTPARITSEIGDLLYHLMVLMVESGISLEDLYQELKHRR